MIFKKLQPLPKATPSLASVGALRFLHTVFNDPLFSKDTQWHFGQIGSLGFTLNFAANNRRGIEEIWLDYQGEDIAVGIWDDGVQRIHWDLSANYDAAKHVTINGTLNDGQPITANDGHGTSVAGLIAADDNGQGGVGIAHDARITAIRIFGGADDINSNWSRYLLTLDSLMNFDVTNHSYGGYPDFRAWSDISKFQIATDHGRNGLGTVNVKSAGNDNIDGNGDALDASRFTVTVAAISNNSTGHIASYSTYGAHILISASAGAVTTDLLGNSNGYNGLENGDYTSDFGGTSAAGPVTASVIALMLDANPGLGWRDVQNILAFSSIGVGSLYTGSRTNENFNWKWNSSVHWNGGGLHYSEDYGYGMVNAFNAVRMSEAWGIFSSDSAISANELSFSTGTLIANRTIADRSTLNYSFNVNNDISLEHVSLTISLTHTDFTNLRIRLISPDDTLMSLYDGSTGNGTTSDNRLTYTFGLDGFRGTDSAGTWTLQIQDAVRRDSGTLNSVNFTAYGSVKSNNEVYHYTNEVLAVLSLSDQSSRLNLIDTNGGVDWINASAMTDDLLLYLDSENTSSVGGIAFLNIAAVSIIENALGGDGNDRIKGNDFDNLIYGMRGDDVLIGGDGVDIAGFRGRFSDYQITAADGVTTVVGIDGTDVLTGFELLRFDDEDRSDPSAGLAPPDSIAPTLTSSAPADNATMVPIGSNIVLTFSEEVRAGTTGSVDIFTSEGILFESMDVSSNAMVFNGKTVSLDLVSDLAKDDAYYVLVDLGAIEDAAGNPYVGISLPTALNFTTESSLNVITGTIRGDRLTGTGGSDRLEGLAGSDILNGKLGADVLVGGLGKDIFVFDTPLGSGNIDVIEGFNVRDDTIRIENAIFTNLIRNGTLNSNFFRANESGVAIDANDYIVFDKTSGHLLYDADGNGAGEAVHFVTLTEIVGSLTNLNFIVI